MRSAPILLALFVLGCPKPDPVDSDPGTDSTPPVDTERPEDSEPPEDSQPDDTAPEVRWTGTADVSVTDPEGVAVEGAFVMVGGAPMDEWATTDAQGLASVEVGDDGITDRWVLVGMEGYTSGGADIRDIDGPSGTLSMVLTPLPALEADNLDYHFQPGGTSHAMDTTECGHCHPTKTDDWIDSSHKLAGSNTHTWDMYVGGTAVDAEVCEALGGWMGVGQEPGVEGGTTERCYTGVGVLPFLYDDCGGEGAAGCDHPDQATSLDVFGSCGDCHTPAVDGSTGGQIDLARATGIAYEEGVTCDLCHKTRSVTAGAAPGRDGAIQLQRPSEETFVVSQEFDPITFGPYPDVVVAIMKGAYDPGMRSSAWCSSCHEYARPGLRDDLPVDAGRWPDGLPINETWSECEAGSCASSTVECSSCHLDVLDEESSTYDISERDVSPAVDQGWLRANGEIRRHDFAWFRDEDVYLLDVDLEEVDLQIQATVEVSNESGGHALPTGHPMRQLIVLVEAVDEDGASVAAVGGQAVPDVGGYRLRAELGVDVSVDGAALDFGERTLPAASTVRFVRPTERWDDYEGPGTASFSGASAEEKGLPVHEVLGERAISSVAGGFVIMEGAAPELQAGDIVYMVDGSDSAGAAGWLFAKVMVDSQGERGVAHYRAVDIASDNRLGPGVTNSSTHVFSLPEWGETTTVTARLISREYAAPIANGYGWETGDEAVLEASEDFELTKD